MDKLLVVIGGTLLFALVVFCMALFTGFTVSVLWGWFLVPLGLAKIGFAHAYGISLFGSVLLSTRGINASGKGETKLIVTGIGINLLALLLGWVAVGFM